MRQFLMRIVFTLPVISGRAMVILVGESGRKFALLLWLKAALAWIIPFGALGLMGAVSVGWLREVLGLIGVLVVLAPIFTSLEVLLFYILPGIRIDNDRLWVKDSWTAAYSCYAFRDIVQICQITHPPTKKKVLRYHVEVLFSDGSMWHTEILPAEGLPFFVDLTNGIKEMCDCPVSPEFDPAAILIHTP